MKKLSILILDDEKRLREEIAEFLAKRNYVIFEAGLPSEAFDLIQLHEIDIAIVDIRLPEISGLEVLQRIKKEHPSIEVLMISGHGDMQTVIESMRLGAFDYFQKPFKLNEVNHAIQRTQRFIELNRQLENSRKTVSVLSEKLYTSIGKPMIGQSNAIKQISDLMERVAAFDTTTVLITGESGTGKELVAHGIHLLSGRNRQFFHSINCSAITDGLFESEFFGHRKGAFTGATEDRAGWFESASGGTLFLDEVGDMPLGQQAKLLRTLEERTIRKVGGFQDIDVDVRVIAASNQHLEEMVKEKKFRGDLYHRLSTFIIHLPPLRERKEDIPLLMEHFLRHFSVRMNKSIQSISEDVLKMMRNYSFPGNIREMRNLMERAIILCDGKQLELNHFPGFESTDEELPCAEYSTFDLDLIEKNTIIRALKKCDLNKSKSAVLLGITWQSLDRKIKKLNITSKDLT